MLSRTMVANGRAVGSGFIDDHRDELAGNDSCRAALFYLVLTLIDACIRIQIDLQLSFDRLRLCGDRIGKAVESFFKGRNLSPTILSCRRLFDGENKPVIRYTIETYLHRVVHYAI